MRSYNVRIPVGIGDVIYIRAQLDSVRNKFGTINISPDLRRVRKGYKDFLLEWMSIVFHPNYYNISLDQSYPFKTPIDMWKKDKIFPQKPNLRKELCVKPIPDYLEDGKYVAINTKVRDIKRFEYNSIKIHIFNALSEIKDKDIKFVILGEQEILQTNEYQHRGYDKIYSIYNDIIKSLPKDRIIDLSVPNLEEDQLDIDKILLDCSILGKSVNSINVGVGGSFCMASATSNLLGLINIKRNLVGKYLFLNKEYDDILVTDNFGKFLNAIKSIK